METRKNQYGTKTDAEIRVGHPGRSALALGISNVSIGPQTDTYEDILVNNREEGETLYFDEGISWGAATAFIIGYHYDVSISFSGMIEDGIEYITSFLN